jgi:dUTPase
MILFFGAYVWVMSSGHEHIVIEQGRNICQAVISWFDDAEIDFQTKQKSQPKKKSRRWD